MAIAPASGSIFSTGQTPFPLRGTFQPRRPRFEKCLQNPMVHQHFSGPKRPDPFVRSEKTTMEAGKKTGMLQRKKNTHIYIIIYIYINIYITIYIIIYTCIMLDIALPSLDQQKLSKV
jgi:hypothetical protein